MCRAGMIDGELATITRFTGSMLFVCIHLAIFGFWIIANLRWIPSVPL